MCVAFKKHFMPDIKELQEALEKANAKIGELDAFLKVANTNIELLEKTNEELTALNESYVAEIEKLSAAPIETVVATSPLQQISFDNDGKTYGFHFPSMNLNGTQITAEMVAADKDLQDQLIAKGSGMIYEK
jgi:hypothetical protein